MKNVFYYTVIVTCANTEHLLQRIIEERVKTTDISYIDDITISVRISPFAIKKFIQICRNVGAEVSIIDQSIVNRYLQPILFRPILLVGITLIFCLSILISRTVLFVLVEGNQTISTNEILNHAESCGLSFGKNKAKINSEQIKNDLLEKVPLLQWVGINTSGCVAKISVKERLVSTIDQPYQIPANIVAQKDGIVCSVSSTKGNVKCKVGQAVEKGDLLIAATKEFEKVTVFCGAEGEVFADTVNEIQVVTPKIISNRSSLDRSFSNLSIIFGKKLINLFKDSRILHSGCVKIYDENNIMLPGGFCIPVKFCYEYIKCYNIQAECCVEAPWLYSYGRKYISGKMISGKIFDEQVLLLSCSDCIMINMRLTCCEMISKTKIEEIYFFNGKDQRTDR